jgi:signal transduction histidine kinase
MRKTKWIIVSLLFLFSVCLTASAENDNSRFESWPPAMKALRQKVIAKGNENTLADIYAFEKEAKKSRMKDCLSWAYYFKIFYFTAIRPQEDKALSIIHQMRKEKMTEEDINKSLFDIIYLYQMQGNSVKAVNMCREILNTSKDKSAIVEALSNIMLLYDNFGMTKEAVDKAKQLAHYSESITEPRIFHYTLATIYGYVADFLLELNRPQEALPYLVKCDSIMIHDGKGSPAFGNNDPRAVYVTWGKYYLEMNDDKSAWRYISKLEDYHSDVISSYAEDLEVRYYLKHHEYQKAKEAMDRLIAYIQRAHMNYGDAERTMMQAKIASGLGKYRDASKLYEQYINKTDSLRRQADEFQTNEYAVQLNLNNANLESNESKAKADRYRMRLMQVVTSVFLLIFIAAIIVIFVLRRINKKLHHANHQLEDAYRRMEKLSNMKTSFLQNISHEIRTPLNSIVGFSQILGENNKENKEFADIINGSSNQLLKIVDDMLDISDLESGDIVTEPTNVNVCCEMVIKKFRRNLSEDVDIVYEPSDKGLVIMGNSMRLKQIVSNLLDNAVKYTSQGKIVVNYEKEGEQLHLFVKDNGPGIPKEKVEWVFERFAKLDNFSQGCGLGLPICQMIVEKMNGRIAIDASYQEGCKVDVWLPVGKEK